VVEVEWLTAPEVPVMVTESVPACVGGWLEQPATTTNSAAAPAKPSRVRKRGVTGSISSRIAARATSNTCGVEMGGVFLEAGGTEPCVVIVTVPVAPPAVAITGEDCGAQLPCGMEALQDSVTAPVKPPRPVTVTVMLPLVPGCTVIALALMVKSHAVPLSVTVWGLPEALSATVSVAERLPLTPAGGAKAMLITQVAFAANVAPLVQVEPATIEKSDAFVPPIAGAAVRFRFALPVFLTVTV
jgi:hypothetical protein